MKRIYRNVDVVDRETGDVLNERGERVEVGEKEEAEGAVRNGLFCKVWKEGAEEISELEDMEIVFLGRIMRYVWYEDNTIRQGNEPMNVKEMAEATKISYARLSERIKDLIKRRVVGKHDSSVMKGYKGRRGIVYTINPYIYCKGVMIPKEIKRYFKTRCRNRKHENGENAVGSRD